MCCKLKSERRIDMKNDVAVKSEDFRIYLAARKIADLSYEFASAQPGGFPWLEDRRDRSVAPNNGQTKIGLFLEIYLTIPGKIWTPWGYWSCWGCGTGWNKKTMDAFLDRLGATKARRMRGEAYGHVYAVHRVDDMRLPSPVARNTEEYLPCNQAKEEWEKFTQYYHDFSDVTMTCPATCLKG
jgi:hypothetical protein